MSAQAQALHELADSQSGAARSKSTDQLVLVLLALGLLASTVMLITYLKALESQADQVHSVSMYLPDIAKPPLFYVAHAMQITLLLAAGLVAFLSTDFRTIERGYLLRFGLFLAAAVLMSLRGYSASDLLSTRLVDSTGPVPCFMSLLVFVGAQRKYWVVLGKAMVILAIVFSTMALVALAGLQTFTRGATVVRLGGILNALYWPAAWILLKDYPRNSYARRLRFVPVVIYSFVSFFTQNRLNFIMVFALLVVYSYLQYRRNAPQAGVWIVALGLAVWAGLFTGTFLRDTSAFHTFESVGDAFFSRIDEDTRTGQLRAFAQHVPPEELLLGRGSFATWDWGRTVNWGGGTDVGYLTLLLYGGVPLLITYIAAHLKPCITVLRSTSSSWRLAAAGVVLLWTVRMFSSSYLGLTLDYYPVLFCVGVCISREPSSHGLPVQSNVSESEALSAHPLVYE